MGLLLLPFIAVLLRLIKAETGDAYHGPPQARELFSYNDKLFYFYSDRVPWDEANAICEAGEMHLSNLDDPAKAKFAAESISEAWMVFEDMWIGAKKGELGKWIWKWTNKRVPEDPQMLGNTTYMYPPWVDNEIPARDGKDCLAVDRNGHNDPYFVDLDCKLPRPFICEQNLKQKKTDPWQSGVVNIFDMEFILYHGRLSWSSAVSFCRQQGYSLATVENMSVARKLAKAMLKSRPEFEDAWIGANLKDEQWVWVESGEEIRTIPADYKDPHRGESPDNIITPQFPPWFEPEPRKGRECVIFDRHLCDEPKFIDLKCNRQRDFICIKRQAEAVQEERKIIIDRAKKRYIFFPVSATWDEAKRICDEESESSTMLNLTDSDETRFIMQAMSDARKPIDHLWLGGKIINEKWVWIARDVDGEENTPISMKPDESGFPPWCDNETSVEMSCLNLDRQNHWTPLIYGLECNSTQAVVCVQPVEPNDRIVEYDGAGGNDPPVSLRISKVTNPISWHQADLSCKRDVGKLWRPRFDLPDGPAAIEKFFTTVHSSQDAEKEQEVYHVDGGTYSVKDGAWIHDGKRVNITTGWDPYDGDCLVGQINKSSSAWTWFPVRCYHKLYSQVICQPRCSLKEVPYEKDDSEWICDAASSEIFDHKMINMGCSHRCPKNRIAQGPDRFFCQKDGWRSSQANVPVTSSECKDPENGLDSFRGIPDGISTLAFVIDSTSDSPADYNATKYIIGNLIDYYHSHLKGVTVHVVSIETNLTTGGGETAKIAVKDFKPSDDCASIKTEVLDALVDSGIGVRDYAAGLTKVREALGDSTLGEANIVFIMPEANQKSSFKEKATEINEEAKVYAIGTNRHAPVNQLVDVASKIGGQSFAIQFKNPPQIFPAVKKLMSDCEQCKCKEAFNDLETGLSTVTIAEAEADHPTGDVPAPKAEDAAT